MKTKTIGYLSLALVFSGALFFLMYNKWVVISMMVPGLHRTSLSPVNRSEKKSVALWYWHDGSFKHEKKDVLWSANATLNITYLVKSWLNLIDEEEVIQKPCALQAAVISPSGAELFLSFDRSFFDQEYSAHNKLMLIEGLLKTVREAGINVQRVRFLSHHQPLGDEHLDFTIPWPLTGFVVPPDSYKTPNAVIFKEKQMAHAPFTIMLDPAGDAQNTGRVIGDMFERGVTLQCAEKLKVLLESQLPGVRIVLTRLPGETLEMLQNATFANKLNVDLYISLHFYHADGLGLPVYLYYFVTHPYQDFVCNSAPALSLAYYHQAHLDHCVLSRDGATMFYGYLAQLGAPHHVVVHKPIGMPFKPLVGIKAPAIALEMGIKRSTDWEVLVGLLAHAIADLVNGAQRL